MIILILYRLLYSASCGRRTSMYDGLYSIRHALNYGNYIFLRHQGFFLKPYKDNGEFLDRFINLKIMECIYFICKVFSVRFFLFSRALVTQKRKRILKGMVQTRLHRQGRRPNGWNFVKICSVVSRYYCGLVLFYALLPTEFRSVL